MKPLIITPGTVFNNLTILKEAPPQTVYGSRPKRQFLCECVCKRIIVIRLDTLRNNKKSSCGCRLPVKIVKTGNPIQKHGLCKTPLYKIWKKIKERCYSVTNPRYFRYGGRGISMSNEWYSDPASFYNWSINNGYRYGLELDRIDNDSGYFPENCRWTTSEVNGNNKSNNIKYNYNGVLLTLPQILRERGGVTFSTLYRRINVNKLSIEEALTMPKYSRFKKK